MLVVLEFLTLRDRGEGTFPFLCPHPVTPFSILPYLILKYLMTMGNMHRHKNDIHAHI